ncbi:MAG: phosphoglycerate transporter [Chloroflexi bacterium]|jgi:phosphoribosylglycinamide formyltransferase 1|nr:phosphoglycerate transporter [Chloroflexota bacterium]MBT7080721.1 phosphoglycerate transporter [Chloroflexota bacterium]MBT7289574.1 phosphoglycerate transporter [Chloroflexota bacterium]
MYRIGWFSSGRGAGSRALLTTAMDNILSGNIKAKIGFVFCNREPGQADETDKFHRLVKSYGIPLIYCSSKQFEPKLRKADINQWRAAYDKEVIRALDGYEADLCVLAGYMLVTGPEMCSKYNLLNLHPAVPGGPKGTWKEVIWQLIDEGASETGIMMHQATPELDEGPPVTCCQFSIRGPLFDGYWEQIRGKSISEIQAGIGEENSLFEAIRKYGLMREYPLIVSTIKAFCEGRVRIENDSVVDSNGKTIQAYDLSKEIDDGLKMQGLI